MPKKSHRVASRQAAVSRERKRKKRSQSSQRHVIATPAKPASVLPHGPSVTPGPIAPPPTQPRPSTRPVAPRYQYVSAELRKIALIAGAIFVILIALTFLLG
ncbi:MAG: hypothetical protein E3J65_06480 [Dehalococcoidia bacterium]|nr:MAG: hypothetical protein E3J65_06480 [Dehalococcoidia bacterium]